MKYRENNVRNISAKMFDPENMSGKSQIMCRNKFECEKLIRNIMTKSGT